MLILGACLSDQHAESLILECWDVVNIDVKLCE